MRYNVGYFSRLRTLLYLSPIALAVLMSACASGVSEVREANNESALKEGSGVQTIVALNVPSDKETSIDEAVSEVPVVPDSVDGEIVENVIMTGDVLRALNRFGIRPEGVSPSIKATLANSAYYAGVGEPVPDEYLGSPSLIFIVDEEAHEDLDVDAPRPLLKIDGVGGYEPQSVSVGISSAHHREMVVSYALNGPNDEPLVGPDTSSLELVFQGELENETSFNELHWDLPLVYAETVQSRDVTAAFSDSDEFLRSLIQIDGLHTGEAELAEQSVASDFVVQVELTDEGSSPKSITIPYGQRIALVMRNTGAQEHHFHIQELETDALLWYAKQGTVVSGEPMTMADHSDTGTAPIEDMGDADADDSYFISSGELVSHHVCTSDTGICPTGDWVHAHANPGDWDLIVFVPADRGIFEAVDPLNPDIKAEIVVY